MATPSHWLYLSNWWEGFGHGIFFLGHLWSLAIEEQFYLVWPAIIYLVPTRYLARTCAAGALGSLALRLLFQAFHARPDLIFYLTPFRIEALMYGALVALIVRNPRWTQSTGKWYRTVVSVSAVGLALVCWHAGGTNPFDPQWNQLGYTFLALIFAGSVYWCTTAQQSRQVLARVLSSPGLRKIGRLSYCIYLVHMPIRGVVVRVLTMIASRSHIHLAFGVWVGLTYLLVFFTSLGTAALSWKYFENPLLHLKERWAPVNYRRADALELPSTFLREVEKTRQVASGTDAF